MSITAPNMLALLLPFALGLVAGAFIAKQNNPPITITTKIHNDHVGAQNISGQSQEFDDSNPYNEQPEEEADGKNDNEEEDGENDDDNDDEEEEDEDEETGENDGDSNSNQSAHIVHMSLGVIPADVRSVTVTLNRHGAESIVAESTLSLENETTSASASSPSAVTSTLPEQEHE